MPGKRISFRLVDVTAAPRRERLFDRQRRFVACLGDNLYLIGLPFSSVTFSGSLVAGSTS